MRISIGIAVIGSIANAHNGEITIAEPKPEYPRIAPPIAAVFFLGLFWRRINATGALAALLGGFLVGAARLVAEGISGDSDRWKCLAAFGFCWNGGPFGPLAAESIYRLMKLADRWRALGFRSA